VAVEPLSESEALAVMKLQQKDAMVFRDPGTDLVKFMYRKKDGSVAVLEPEGI